MEGCPHCLIKVVLLFVWWALVAWSRQTDRQSTESTIVCKPLDQCVCSVFSTVAPCITIPCNQHHQLPLPSTHLHCEAVHPLAPPQVVKCCLEGRALLCIAGYARRWGVGTERGAPRLKGLKQQHNCGAMHANAKATQHSTARTQKVLCCAWQAHRFPRRCNWRICTHRCIHAHGDNGHTIVNQHQHQPQCGRTHRRGGVGGCACRLSAGQTSCTTPAAPATGTSACCVHTGKYT